MISFGKKMNMEFIEYSHISYFIYVNNNFSKYLMSISLF